MADSTDVPRIDTRPTVLCVTTSSRSSGSRPALSTARRSRSSSVTTSARPRKNDASENLDQRFAVECWLHGSGGEATGVAMAAAEFETVIGVWRTVGAIRALTGWRRRRKSFPFLCYRAGVSGAIAEVKPIVRNRSVRCRRAITPGLYRSMSCRTLFHSGTARNVAHLPHAPTRGVRTAATHRRR